MTSRQPGERFPVKLIFMFEDFDMTMRFDPRMVYADQDHGRFGCAFLGLSQQQMEVFRYLVDAYLSGEVVSAGDILQLRARDNTASAACRRATTLMARASCMRCGCGATARSPHSRSRASCCSPW